MIVREKCISLFVVRLIVVVLIRESENAI